MSVTDDSASSYIGELPAFARFTDIVQAAFAAQRDRLILWIPVFLGTGIGLYFSLPYEPPVSFGIGITMFVLACFAILWPQRRDSRILFSLWLVVSAFLLLSTGFVLAQFKTLRIQTPMLEKAIGPVDVQGRVVRLERLEEGKGYRFILDDLHIEKLSQDKTPARIRLKVYKGEGIQAGDRISVLARLNPPSAPVMPGAFDFQRYAYFKQIGAFGFAYKEPEIIARDEVHALSGRLELMRETITGKIEKSMDWPEASFAIALMTGERASIAEEDWEAMRSSGLAHMLAISGLHVGLVAGAIFFMSRLVMALFPFFALKYPIKKYAALIAMSGAFSYTMLIGATVSAQRAMLMTGIVLLAVILDRVAISLRLVAIAAAVILFVAPDALLGAGFQMSFAAVTMLVVFYELIRPFWSRWYSQAGLPKKLALYFLGVCFTSLVATLATAPFSLFHFQHLAQYGLMANFLAVPLMAFAVMPAAVLAYLGMFFGLEEYALMVMEYAIKAVITIAHDVSALPGSTYNPPAWPFSGFICIVAGGLFFALWQGRGKVFALLPMAASVIFIFQLNQHDIVISSSGKLIAVNGKNGHLYVSSRVSDRFSREIWARQLGVDEENVKKWPSEGRRDELTCGEYGCRMVQNGWKIAFSSHPYAHREDCEWADIIVAEEPVDYKICRSTRIIDKFTLWREGAHAIRFDAGHAVITSVADIRGKRPWTTSNRR